MANQGKIQFGVGFNVDKSGLHALRSELQSLQQLSEKDLIKIGSTDAVNDLNKIKETAHQVEAALEKSFNPKLNTTDLTKFRTELGNAGLNINSIKANFDRAGQSGQNAFRNLTTELLTTNKHLKESSQLIQKMADTLSNTVRWSIASSALNAMTGQVQKAWSFTKSLDSSLNNIRIVTGKSADEMDRFAVQATKAAQALGASTKSYSDAALIYYQQGLAEQDVQARATVTTKVANVTGQSAAQVSENLTAVWNGYKASAAEAELYIDKISAVAATTAADLEELSIGMSRVASAANIMGVDIDSLNAQLATIVSVTREAPESIGTALKTVYARMSDIEAGLDAETTLGEYTAQMKAMGVNVLDATGNLRDMDDVIEEIGGNWDKLSRNQQVSLAQTIAGTRQYSRMMALFDNWDMYQSAKRTSETSAGELQKQQEIYLDSMEAHLNKLSAETEELYQTLMDPKGLNPLIDALTGLVGLVENFTEALGGGAGALRTFGAIGLNVFNKQITQGITRTVGNISGEFENRQRDISQQALINEYGFLTDGGKVDERTEKLIDAARQRYKVLDAMSEEEKQQSKELIKQTNEYYKQQDTLKAQKAVIDDIAQRYADMKDTSDAKEVTKAIDESVGEIKRQTIEASDLASLKEVGTTQHAVATKKTRVATAHDAMQTAYDDGDEERFDKYYDEWATQIEELTSKQEEAASAAEKQKHAIANVVTVINESTVGTMANAEQQEKLEKITEAVNKAYDQNGNIIADTEKEIEEANAAVEEYNKLLEEMAKEGIEVGKSVKKVNADLVDNKKRIEEAEAALEKAKKNFDLTKNIKQIVTLGGGLANIGSSIATIQNLGSIWNNDDLTTGEKVLQTIINMTTALSMMASGITSVKESFSFFKSIPKLFDELKKARAAAAAANVTANVAETGSEVGLEEQIEETNKDKAARIALNKAQSNSSGDVTKSNIIEGASENADDLPGKEGGKKLAKKGGKWIAKQAGKTGVRVAGGAIVGAVAAAAVSLAIFDYVASAEKRAMEGAQEASNAMQETLSAVTASYDKLSSSISNLENATETLEGLTEGTVEWKQALHDVNSQVLELLREYPELNQYISRDSNGQLVVEKEGLDLIQEKQLAIVQKTQAAAMIAQAKADKENINYLEEEWADAANKSDTARGAVVGTAALTGAAAGAFGAAKIGAAVGTAITPGVGTAIGVAAGAVIGGVVGTAVGGIGTAITEAAEMNNISENEDFKAAFEAYKTSGAGIFDSNKALEEALGKDVGALSEVEKALVANKDATVDLCNAMLNKEAQDYERWVQIGENILGAEASEGAKALAGKEAAENDVVSYSEIESQYGPSWWDNNSANEKALKRLLELSGMGTYVGATGWGKVQYRDKNNNLQDINIDWVYKQLQSYEAAEKVKTKAANYEAEAAKITNLFSSPEAKQAVSKLVTDSQPDLTKLTKSQYETLVKESASAMSALSKEQQNLLTQSITQYNAEWNRVVTSLPKEIQNSFVSIVDNLDLNVDQFQDAATLYNQLFETLGDKGTAAFAGIGAALGDNFGAFVEQVQNTQLDSGNIEDQLRDILKDLKVEDVDAKALRDFAYALEYLTDAGKGSVEAMQKHYKDVYKVALNLKQFDTVSQEFYDKLSSGQKEYFQLMADGTYQLIKDAKEFYGLTRKEEAEQSEQLLVQKLTEYSEAAHALNNKQIEISEAPTDSTVRKDIIDNIHTAYKAELQPYQDTLDNSSTITVAYSENHARKYKDISIADLLEIGNFNTKEELNNALATGKIGQYELVDRMGVQKVSEFQKWGVEEIDAYFALKEKMSSEAITKYEEDNFDAYLEAYITALEIEEDNLQANLESLEKDIPNVIEQYLGTRSTFAEYQNALDKYDYAITKFADPTMLQNNLLRIASEQYDYRVENPYLSKDALDDYLSAKGAKTAEDYAAAIKELVLGMSKLDAAQEAATDSLKDYQKEADELASKDKLNNYVSQMKAYSASMETTNAKLDTYKMGGTNQMALAATLSSVGFTNVDALFNSDGSINSERYQDFLGLASSIEFSSEAEKEAFEAALTSVEQYIADYKALEDEYDTNIANFRSLALESFELTLTLQLDTNNARKEYENFKRMVSMDKDAFASLGQSYLSETVYSLNNISLIEKGLERLEGFKGIFTDAMYEEESKKLVQQFGDEILAAKEAMEQYEQSRLDALDAIAEAYEKQIEFLEDTNALLEYQKTLTELIYGPKAGKYLTDYYGTALSGAQAIEAENKKTYEQWKAAYETAKTDEEKDKAYDYMNQAAKDWAESIVNTLTTAQEKYLNEVANAITAFDEAITNGKGMSAVKDEWDWTTSMQDKYLSSLDTELEKSKLINSFTKAANSSSNVKVQQQINALLQQELNTLNALDKVSQKDFERAQKRLKVLQAEIALQEAQEAKTQMRLVRGADGTYSYEYTADEGKIADAKENVTAAYQDLYKHDYEQYRSKSEEFAALYDEWTKEVQEAYSDGILTDEESESLNKKMERLKEIADEVERYGVNLKETINTSATNLGLDPQVASETINAIFGTSMANMIKTFSDDGEELNTLVSDMMTNLQNSASEYVDSTTEATNALESLFYGADGSGGILGLYSDLGDAQDAVIQKYKDEKEALDDLWDSYEIYKDMIDSFITKYGTLNEKILGVNTSLETLPDLLTEDDLKAFDTEIDKVKEAAEAWKKYWEARGNSADKDPDLPQGTEVGYIDLSELKAFGFSDSDLVGKTPEELAALKTFAEKSGDMNKFNALTSMPPLPAGLPQPSYMSREEYYAYIADQVTTEGFDVNKALSYENYVIAEISKWAGLSHYDTGGLADFTGPAWLDGTKARPELVLNQDDTTNFLDALKILRSLNLSMLENISGLSNVSAKFATGNYDRAPIEQTVHINAEFPDTTDVEEIKEAFNELVNQATQKVLEIRR